MLPSAGIAASLTFIAPSAFACRAAPRWRRAVPLCLCRCRLQRYAGGCICTAAAALAPACRGCVHGAHFAGGRHFALRAAPHGLTCIGLASTPHVLSIPACASSSCHLFIQYPLLLPRCTFYRRAHAPFPTPFPLAFVRLRSLSSLL